MCVCVRSTLPPLLHGGGQELGRRAGTESVLLLVGLGAACALAAREERRMLVHLLTLRLRLVSEEVVIYGV